jgi:hypothetical protein
MIKLSALRGFSASKIQIKAIKIFCVKEIKKKYLIKLFIPLFFFS